MSSKHPIDALFEKELKEHQSQPSEAVWAKIAASQQGAAPKREGFFILRAASVLLLVGLSSFWYFTQNAGSLQVSTPALGETEIVAAPDRKPSTKKENQNKVKEPVQTQPKASNKKSTNGSKKSTKSTKKTSLVIPVLKQSSADPILALNDLAPIDLEDNWDEVEEIEDPNVLRVKLSLPDLQGDYNTEGPTKKKFGERMWAYATEQYDRMIAGEELQLPNTDQAKIEIPLPDFVNRRMN